MSKKNDGMVTVMVEQIVYVEYPDGVHWREQVHFRDKVTCKDWNDNQSQIVKEMFKKL